MQYVVQVKPGSSQEKITEVENGELIVYLHARAHDGEANEALIRFLAKYFKVPKTNIKILRGMHSRKKVVEL